MAIGLILCVVGCVIFIYGISSMTKITVVSDSFLAVIGAFLGIAGFIVFVTSVFSSGSMFK